MRRLALAATIALAFLAQLAAAGPLDVFKGTTPEQRASLQTTYMKEHLALEGEVLERVAALNLATAQSLQPVIDADESTFAEVRKVRAAQKKKEAEFQKLLPPETYQKYEASKSDLRDYVEAGLAQAKDGQ